MLIILLFSLKLCVYTYDQPSNFIVITFLETIPFAWGMKLGSVLALKSTCPKFMFHSSHLNLQSGFTNYQIQRSTQIEKIWLWGYKCTLNDQYEKTFNFSVTLDAETDLLQALETWLDQNKPWESTMMTKNNHVSNYCMCTKPSRMLTYLKLGMHQESLEHQPNVPVNVVVYWQRKNTITHKALVGIVKMGKKAIKAWIEPTGAYIATWHHAEGGASCFTEGGASCL